MNDFGQSDDEASVHSDGEVVPQIVASTRMAQDKSLFNGWLRDQRADAYRSAREPEVLEESTALAASGQMRSKEANIISSPREYQTELFERAKEKNIIAVLDTGCLSYIAYYSLNTLLITCVQEPAKPS